MRASLFISLGGLVEAVAGLECRPNGPIFPRPDLSRSKTFQDAAAKLTGILDQAMNGTIKAGWNINTTSLSIALVSRYQDEPGVPQWEYHHLAEKTFLGTSNLNRDSQYQIGSISKAITDAVLIRSGLDLDTPITDYLPGLGGSPSLIQWDTITLRALASHLGGIPPNLGVSEYYYLRFYLEFLGLPRLKDSDYLTCDVFGLNLGCTKPQMIVGLKNAHPVAPPNTRPVYSNIAFTLLMYAVGLDTGQTYQAFLYEYITGPLNMWNTYPSPGDFQEAVVPPVANSWGFWFGNATPGGGLVSSLSDLTSFLHSILSYKIFESEAKVREWLQPRTFTGSVHSFFGMPWEIFRPPPQAVFPDYDPETETGGHTLTIYTKDGAASGYRSRISMIDEYGVGLVILAAGDSTAVTVINDAILRILIPAVDVAAREQVVEEGYAGTFVSECKDDGFNATIRLDGQSLILDSLHRNGSDIMRTLRGYFGLTYAQLIPNYHPGPILRIYPADISIPSKEGGRSIVKEDWRFVWDVTRGFGGSDLPGQGISSYDCLAWEAVDWMYYGGESVDRIVFVKDAETGEVLNLEVPFLRSTGTQNSDTVCTESPETGNGSGDNGDGNGNGKGDDEDIIGEEEDEDKDAGADGDDDDGIEDPQEPDEENEEDPDVGDTDDDDGDDGDRDDDDNAGKKDNAGEP